jgi:hypothetical protein
MSTRELYTKVRMTELYYACFNVKYVNFQMPYTGANPKVVSENLTVLCSRNAVSCADISNYYCLFGMNIVFRRGRGFVGYV